MLKQKILLLLLVVYVTSFIVTSTTSKKLNKNVPNVQFQISSKDKDPSKALEKVTKLIPKIIKLVQKVDKIQNVTQQSPQIKGSVDKNGKLSTYIATIVVQFRSFKQSNLGKIIEAGAKVGQLLKVFYTLSEDIKKATLDQLFRQAFQSASKKAQRYAISANLSTKEIDTIQINQNVQQTQNTVQLSAQVSILYDLGKISDVGELEGVVNEEQNEQKIQISEQEIIKSIINKKKKGQTIIKKQQIREQEKKQKNKQKNKKK